MPRAAAFERLISLFHQSFGVAPAIVASAPGRVNLIGEHLDYNAGPVLPFAIDRRTWVAAREATEFSMVSSESRYPPVRRAAGPMRGDWSDYVMGTVWALQRTGCALPGAQLAVVSDVQPGAGLSSSAALAVASSAALSRLAGRELPPEALAEVAFRAEHDYVGVRCGRMDQTVVVHAVEGTALFIETATDERATSPFPHAVWVLATGVDHTLAGGGYNARRAECERALEGCRARWPNLPSLAALDPSLLPEALALLPAPLDRRTSHVVTETARTREARRALERQDLLDLGRLLVAGHRSLREDFESSVSEADFLVDTVVARGALGARLTGAGWGGSVIVLAPDNLETEIIEHTLGDFAQRFGRAPAAWRAQAAGGVRLDLEA
jgi:galactokinase